MEAYLVVKKKCELCRKLIPVDECYEYYFEEDFDRKLPSVHQDCAREDNESGR